MMLKPISFMRANADAPAASFFTDDFTGTDAQAITARTGWNATGDNTSKFEILSNRCRLSNISGGAQIITDTSPDNYQRVACDILDPAVDPTGAGWVGPMARCTEAGLFFNGYTPRIDFFNEVLQAGQGDLGSEGAEVTFATILSNYGINIATGCSIAVEATGGSGAVEVKLYIGSAGTTPTTEVTEAAYTDTGVYADLTGPAGIACLNSDIDVDFDNFEVTEVV